MSIKFPYYNACILISDNPADLTTIFHDKIIFKTITDEHLTKIFILQKIKRKANNPTSMTIYFHNRTIDSYNLHKKLVKMLQEKELDVSYKYITDITDQDIIQIATYSKFMETFKNS